MDFTWLADGTEPTVRAAIAAVAPDLAGEPVDLAPRVETSDPRWACSSALVGGSVFVKFAWSEPAALRRYREVRLLDAVAASSIPLLPAVVFSSISPVLLGTRKVDGGPLTFEMTRAIDHRQTGRAGDQLGAFLADLHRPEVLMLARSHHVPLGSPDPQSDTARLRDRFVRLVTPDRAERVLAWCDWVDQTLAPPVNGVLVHGDFHGHNLVWEERSLTLRAVFDFETAAEADPAFDFRYLPGHFDVFVATARRYEAEAGEPVDLDRVMAWHVRTALGDALWRTEAAVPLPGGGDADVYVDRISEAFTKLGIDAT
jgi:aminoglycoside phosphotransferase (APT) family kinase protein